MITIKLPTDKLQLTIYDEYVTVRIKDLDAAQFRKMAEKMVEQPCSGVTLRDVTLKEGF